MQDSIQNFGARDMVSTKSPLYLVASAPGSAQRQPRDSYELEAMGRSEWETSCVGQLATHPQLQPGIHNLHLHVHAAATPSLATDLEITVKVIVFPSWWNTWWFRGCYLGTALAGICVAYRHRLRAASKAHALGLQERADERTRLSRELHDTLMQTIQGSQMIADYSKELTDPAQHRAALEKVSVLLKRASDEGRAAMRTLRAPASRSCDLYHDLKHFVHECAAQHCVHFSFAVPTARRPVRALAQKEAFHIGCEAIRNACAHADATRIEIELQFEHDLLLTVRDDGRGMSPVVASRGREGHFGLRGMRERAARIGAMFSIDTSPGRGTVVTLRVSRAIAFEPSAKE
jgi:signal transduction histidine kinase